MAIHEQTFEPLRPTWTKEGGGAPEFSGDADFWELGDGLFPTETGLPGGIFTPDAVRHGHDGTNAIGTIQQYATPEILAGSTILRVKLTSRAANTNSTAFQMRFQMLRNSAPRLSYKPELVSVLRQAKHLFQITNILASLSAEANMDIPAANGARVCHLDGRHGLRVGWAQTIPINATGTITNVNFPDYRIGTLGSGSRRVHIWSAVPGPDSTWLPGIEIGSSDTRSFAEVGTSAVNRTYSLLSGVGTGGIPVTAGQRVIAELRATVSGGYSADAALCTPHQSRLGFNATGSLNNMVAFADTLRDPARRLQGFAQQTNWLTGWDIAHVGKILPTGDGAEAPSVVPFVDGELITFGDAAYSPDVVLTGKTLQEILQQAINRADYPGAVAIRTLPPPAGSVSAANLRTWHSTRSATPTLGSQHGMLLTVEWEDNEVEVPTITDALDRLANVVLPGAISGLTVQRGPVIIDDLNIGSAPTGVMYDPIRTTTLDQDAQQVRSLSLVVDITAQVVENDAFEWLDMIDTYRDANLGELTLNALAKGWFVAASELFSPADEAAFDAKTARTLRLSIIIIEREP